jgi:hypothetical protein
MSKPIFFDCITNEGNKSINIENIALIENIYAYPFLIILL